MRCRRCFWRREPADDENALTTSLQDISQGCKALTQVDLPSGSAQLLVDIRKNLRELQDQIQGARAPVVLPWARPLQEDQALEFGTLVHSPWNGHTAACKQRFLEWAIRQSPSNDIFRRGHRKFNPDK